MEITGGRGRARRWGVPHEPIRWTSRRSDQAAARREESERERVTAPLRVDWKESAIATDGVDIDIVNFPLEYVRPRPRLRLRRCGRAPAATVVRITPVAADVSTTVLVMHDAATSTGATCLPRPAATSRSSCAPAGTADRRPRPEPALPGRPGALAAPTTPGQDVGEWLRTTTATAVWAAVCEVVRLREPDGSLILAR
ncbi:hypothetical protein ACOBQB_00970 [Streptomyces sp. G5(2025)]|uniref:hypothetical protein n=1 Tax=Streptomyces sp. G5(2025) TaxID=3406628 RepID=UPI003C1DEFA5